MKDSIPIRKSQIPPRSDPTVFLACRSSASVAKKKGVPSRRRCSSQNKSMHRKTPETIKYRLPVQYTAFPPQPVHTSTSLACGLYCNYLQLILRFTNPRKYLQLMLRLLYNLAIQQNSTLGGMNRVQPPLDETFCMRYNNISCTGAQSNGRVTVGCTLPRHEEEYPVSLFSIKHGAQSNAEWIA